ASFDAATLTVKSLHVDHAQFPWSGVTGEGTYAFLSSSDLLAYVSGRVFDVDGSALSGVRVDALTWPLTAVTEPDGTFATAIRAAGATLTSANPTTLDVGAVSVTASFTTEDLTPPDAKPYLVKISLPYGDPVDPVVTITGAPGAVCPGCHVVAFNDTTQATSSTNALSDGSFTLTLHAKATDEIHI